MLVRTTLAFLLLLGCSAAPQINSTTEPLNGCPVGCTCPPSPILIDVSGKGFNLTDAAGGVTFDIRANGHPEHVAWTATGSDNAWLALDRNGNGLVDDGSELFGNSTPQPWSSDANGFNALADYDKPERGGNGDGQIESHDAIYTQLRLWQDTNHDGISQPGELHGLAELGVVAVSLNYAASQRKDQYGNIFRYRAAVTRAPDTDVGPFAVDVFLMTSVVPIAAELRVAAVVPSGEGCTGLYSTFPSGDQFQCVYPRGTFVAMCATCDSSGDDSCHWTCSSDSNRCIIQDAVCIFPASSHTTYCNSHIGACDCTPYGA